MVFISFLVFLIISIAIALFFRQSIELALPLTVVSIIAILFFSGLTGSLLFGLYLIWIIAGLSVLYIIRQSIVDFSLVRRCIFRPGFFALLAIFFVSVFWHRYDVVNTWDELAQWASAARNAFFLDTFASNPLSNKGYSDYPPAAELFHYFWTKTSGGFKDSTLYISMNIFAVSFLIPVLQKFSPKNIFKSILAMLVVLLVPYTLFPGIYTHLMVDPLLGLVFAWVLYTYYLNRQQPDNFTLASLSLGLFALPLIKESGSIFAVMATIIITFDQIILHPFGQKISSLLRLLPLAIAFLLAKKTWVYELASMNVAKTWKYDNVLEYIQTSLLPWQKTAFSNFYHSIFNYHHISETSQTIYHLGPFSVSAIVWIIFLAALSLFTLFLYQKQGKAFFSLVFIGAIFYICLTSFLYLLSFSEGETLILSSFSRYINSYLVAILLLCTFLILNYFAAVQGRQVKPIFFAILILLATTHISLEETPLVWLNSSSAHKKKDLYLVKTNYNLFINQLRPFLRPDAILHNFYGSIADSQYNLCPIKVASPLWQSADFDWFRTYARRQGYTHVFFENSFGSVETDEFNKKFSDIFLPGSQIKNNALYEVVWQGELPKLKFITQVKPLTSY